MMKKTNLVLMAALAAAGLVTAGGGTLLPTVAVAAEPAPKLGAKIVKPLKAAQDAMNAKNWDEAMAGIEEARAIEPKTPYEAFMVDELGWYVLLQKKDYAAAAAALERAVAAGFVAPADLPQRYKAIAQLNYQIQNFDKAIEFGNKYLESAPGDTDIGVLVAQSYYMKKDYAGTAATVQKLTAGAAKPSEQLLMLGLRSNYELKDRAATVKLLESLVRHYPQPKYWEDLLTNQLYQTKTDREMRALYRLIDETQTLDKAEEYSEMASTLITGGYPTEAKQVLERGMAKSVFTGDAKTRAQSDLNRAKSGADADSKELPGADKALAAAKSGNEMVAMGKLFFSVGDYTKAANAIQKGVAKGGVTDIDDANALLGISLVRNGKPAEARAAFSAIKDPKLAEVARLWNLYLDTTASEAATPAG
jgi:tetratricopeptide (TPR) repeat protein